MYRPFPPPVPAALVLLLASAQAAAGVVNPGCTRTWPGAACTGTLQQCITAAPANCDLQIATNGPVTESIVIAGKSLHLMAAGGYTPVFGAADRVTIQVLGGTSTTSVTFDGLELANARLEIFQNGGDLLHVAVSNTLFSAAAAERASVLLRELGPTATGHTRLRLTGNYFTHQPGVDNVVAVVVEDLKGVTEVSLVSNIFDALHDSRPAVELFNGQGLLTIEARGNYLRSPIQGGWLGVYQLGIGRTVARIVNNVIEGDPANLLPSGNGIAAFALAGTTELLMLNNTSVYNGKGIVVQTAPGAALDGMAANNLVAFNGAGLTLPDGFPNRHNLVHGNGADDFNPGPRTITADPQLMPWRGGALGLAATSPAIDAGDLWLLPPDILTDQQGLSRVSGFGLDIGALEVPSDGLFRDGFDGED